MNDLHLALIQKTIPSSIELQSRFIPKTTSIDDPSLAAWNAEGSPHLWELVEQHDDKYYVYRDRGYGKLAVVYINSMTNELCMDYTTNNIIVLAKENIMIVDTDYYSVKKYIWKAV